MLCKSKISNKGGEVKIGDKIGIAFDFGKLEYPKYGKIEDCSGIIPLLLPFGDVKIPPIVYNTKDLADYAKEIRIEYQYLWEEELDEDIENKMADFIMLVAFSFYNEGLDVKSKEGKLHVVGATVGFILDDIFDARDEIQSIGFSYKTVIKMMEQLWDGEIDQIPNLAPKLLPYFKFLSNFKSNYNENDTKNKEFIGPMRRERNNSFTVTALMMETGKNGEEEFSEDTLLDFNGYQSGILPTMEALAFQWGIFIPHYVRDDVLFKRFGNCVANAGNLYNCILGIKRDLEENLVNDSQILRDVVRHGMSLEAAFKKTFKHLLNALQDLRVGGKKLKKRYDDEPQVLRYVDFASHVVDQQLYWYAHATRYGTLNLKIQKI